MLRRPVIEPPEIDLPFERPRLDTGLRMSLHRHDRLPLVANDLGYHVGSRDATPGRPGPRTILSVSALDGREARWRGGRARQMTVLKRPGTTARRHWLHSALRGAAPAEPLIATAAVEQAMGGGMPGMALLRALSVGDDEAAAELGALSLLEEDMALVDYVTAASPRFANLLRASLDRVEANA